MRVFKQLCTIVLILTTFILLFLLLKPDNSPKLVLKQSTFQALPGWENDNHHLALLSFIKSCHEINRRSPEASFTKLLGGQSVAQWQKICAAAKDMNEQDPALVKQFFEFWFDPYLVTNNKQSKGLFTGYYLPILTGSLTQRDKSQTPIYGLPNDLIKINLDAFRPEFSGKPIIGYLNEHKLYPYPDRSSILKGAIHNKAAVIAWSDNDIDIFFAQIQGSAILQLPDRQQLLLSYVGDNGRHYVAIGKTLIERKQLNKKNISMQSIRNWLEQHPTERGAIMNLNPSYVFFKLLDTADPIGSQGVPLTAFHSLAVDTNYIPLGAPLWLDTTIPQHDSLNPAPFQHLVIAQDTGGAINGIIRGDIYCGSGSEAEFLAGHLQSTGRYWLLLPKKQKLTH